MWLLRRFTINTTHSLPYLEPTEIKEIPDETGLLWGPIREWQTHDARVQNQGNFTG